MEHAYNAGAVRRRPIIGRDSRAGAPTALGIAAFCLLGLVVTWVVAELVPGGQVRDSVVLYDFELLSRPHVDLVANGLLDLLQPALFTCWGLILVTVALVRERPRVALAVALVLGLAPLSSEILKPLLAHPHVQIGGTHIGPASWPSGHATAALALVLCAVLVAPVRRRPLVLAIGAAFAVSVGCSLLILAWRRASDRRWPSARSRGRSGAAGPGPRAVRARVP